MNARTRARRRWRATLAMVGALGLTACVTAPYGGAPRADVAVARKGPSGFDLPRPDVLLKAQGLRVHGALCRKRAWSRAPTRLRLERLSPAGVPLGVVIRPIHGLATGRRHCMFYDVSSPGPLEPGQTLRLTAE